MIKNVLSQLKPLIITILFASSAFAQNADKNVNEKLHGKNGLPNFITFKENTTYKSSNSRQVFTEQLGLKQNQSFVSTKTEADQIGYSHEKFQLFHEGIKVEYATYTLHSKNGKLVSMNGDFYHFNEVTATPKISSVTAFNKAITHIGASAYLWENPEEAAIMKYEQPRGQLVFLPSMKEQGVERTSDKVRLAYKFDIYATNPISRGDIYIDAETSEVLYYNATIKHLGEHVHGNQDVTSNEELPSNATALIPTNVATRYSGEQTIQTLLDGATYTLFDYTRGISLETFNMNRLSNYSTATKFTDADNNWTAAEYNNSFKDNAALDAHWGAEKTFDYFLSTFNRNSYNNTGGNIVSFIHFASAYNNAYWNGAVMTYGDGNGTTFDALTSLDVAAHEIGHAVCETTANLVYQKESGAMNEGFSDIWGACVEFFAAPTKATWLIGEDIERRVGRPALRSMSDPKSLNQPDTYGGSFWINPNCTPTSTNDYCGVHTNSGVLNHWFYVLSVGESGTNDIGSVYNVSGITMAKAAKIAYRLESVYLTANSTYANARTFGIQSAIDIYGANSAEVIATTNAFYAVGIGAAYAASGGDAIAPTTPLNLAASGTTATTTQLTWNAATDNIAVTGYAVFNGLNLIGTTAGLSFNVTGLMGATNYTFTIKARDAVGNISTASNSAIIITLVAPAGLPLICSSQGNSIDDERIGRVQFGTIDNVSVGGFGYNDFTSISTTVLKGSNQTIIITPTWPGTVYPEGYAVFIDYNADGDFSDAGETVYTKAVGTATPASGAFVIPANAATGPTRMRVSMRYNAIPTACQTFDYGQVEDYTVVIIPPTTVISTKFIIQGFYDNEIHAMRPVKANQGVGVSTTDVDTVTLELRNPSTFAVFLSTTATLQTNGMVTISFPSVLGSYYLVIKHRNGLQTWSATPLTLSAVTPLYDFTTQASKAFGSNMIQVEPGVWAFYSGDINQDEVIDLSDAVPLFDDNDTSAFGFLATDLNGDGAVDNTDVPFLTNNSEASIYSIHP